MGVASGCGEQEAGVASGSGWNLWVWLLGVVVRRYIDFLILLIPTPLVSVLFYSSIPTFLFIFIVYTLFGAKNSVFQLFQYILCPRTDRQKMRLLNPLLRMHARGNNLVVCMRVNS